MNDVDYNMIAAIRTQTEVQVRRHADAATHIKAQHRTPKFLKA